MKDKERYVYMINVGYGSPFFLLNQCEGFYSNKKSALKVYKNRVKKMFEEVPQLTIPYEIFLKHIVDFEYRGEYIWLLIDEELDYSPKCLDYIWKDYMGYRAEEWEKSRKEYLIWNHLTRTREITLRKDGIMGKNGYKSTEYLCSEMVK